MLLLCLCLLVHGLLPHESSLRGQDSTGATYSLELGHASGPPGSQLEIPLSLSADGAVEGVQAVFEWDGSAGAGVDLIVAPRIAEVAEFASVHVDTDWMALGIVTLATPLTGASIPLATAVIRCGSAPSEAATPIVFRDGAHRVDFLLSNAVTVDCAVDCVSVRREDGLGLSDGSFHCALPPCAVGDLVSTREAGLVRLSWSLSQEADCGTRAIEVRAGSVTRFLGPDAKRVSILCASLPSSGTVCVVSIGADGSEKTACSSYACGGFTRGDGNDDGRVDVSDAVTVLSCLFRGRPCPDCLDAGDCNDDGRVDTSDAVCVLSCVFGGGACPAAPFPGCGIDTTGDALGCADYESCL